MPPHPTLYLRKSLREGRQLQNGFWLRGGLRAYGEIDTFARPSSPMAGDPRLHGGRRDEQPVAYPSLESTPNGLRGLEGKRSLPEISHFLLKPLRNCRSFGGDPGTSSSRLGQLDILNRAESIRRERFRLEDVDHESPCAFTRLAVSAENAIHTYSTAE